MSHLIRLLLLLALAAAYLRSQSPPKPYSRHNTFSAFTEYSNDSSHIILGGTPNRKLAAFGVQYEHRLVSAPHLSWSYVAEFRPFILSSDPTSTFVQTNTSPGPPMTISAQTVAAFRCTKGTQYYSFTDPSTQITYSNNVVTTCGRQHTYAQGLAPVGFRISLFPRRPVQAIFSSNGGYMFSTRPIPIANAGAFNFTFEFGGGLEYYRARQSSVRLEYLVQHYSNHNTADVNPGVDSGFIKLTYAFGR